MKLTQVAFAVGTLCGGMPRWNAMFSGGTYLRAGGVLHHADRGMR